MFSYTTVKLVLIFFICEVNIRFQANLKTGKKITVRDISVLYLSNQLNLRTYYFFLCGKG